MDNFWIVTLLLPVSGKCNAHARRNSCGQSSVTVVEKNKSSICNTILINFSEREVGSLASEGEAGLEIFQHCVLIPRHQTILMQARRTITPGVKELVGF